MNTALLPLSEAVKALKATLNIEAKAIANNIPEAMLGHWLMDQHSHSSFLPKEIADIWPQIKNRYEQLISPVEKASRVIRESQGQLNLDWQVKLDNIPKFTCIDLFSGCGGLSLGLEKAGFTPLLFSEINKDAASTYLANRTTAGYFQYSDISTLTNANINRHLNFWKENGEKHTESILVWQLSTLLEKLTEKHKETFWVSAETQKIGGKEQFHFKKIKHTRSPHAHQFPNLLSAGLITIDHLIKERNNSAQERGPLFKINNTGFKLLFPSPIKFDLTRPH